MCVSILNIFAANLIWQNPIYLCGGELLVKDVDNVDDMGGLQHVGVVSKGPGGEDDQYYHSQFVIMSKYTELFVFAALYTLTLYCSDN